MDVKIEESWKALLQEEFDKPYFAELIAFVKNEYAQTRIFPPGKLIFNAFNHCTVDNTKVVILGQDPYHGPGQAHGLCFSWTISLRELWYQVLRRILSRGLPMAVYSPAAR